VQTVNIIVGRASRYSGDESSHVFEMRPIPIHWLQYGYPKLRVSKFRSEYRTTDNDRSALIIKPKICTNFSNLFLE